MTGDFRVATAVRPDEHVPGRLHAEIPPGWNSPAGVHGGVFLATVARAMLTRVADPDLVLRTVHASFLSRPASGSLVIDTEVVRRGGVTTHVRAAARGHGQDEQALDAWALFTRPRSGDALRPLSPPEVPPPGDCAPVEVLGPPAAPGGLGRPPLFDHLEIRPAVGIVPWREGWTPHQEPRYVCWYRYRTFPASDDPRGHPDLLALLPPADLPAPSLWLHYAPDDPVRALLSLEYTAHVLERPTTEWFCVDTRLRWMDDGYVLMEGRVWNDGRFVAATSQVMLVRVVPAPPSPVG
ncbi:MAG: thioesterase family protein [Acidimicrobiales bacterium]|nr:thioesterase family protein [Acidimicrobiales bacterium]